MSIGIGQEALPFIRVQLHRFLCAQTIPYSPLYQLPYSIRNAYNGYKTHTG
jgi:hypothetical protein